MADDFQGRKPLHDSLNPDVVMSLQHYQISTRFQVGIFGHTMIEILAYYQQRPIAAYH